jgi:hypothetical protein
MLVFGRRPSRSGTTVPQLFPNCFFGFSKSTDFSSHIRLIFLATRTKFSRCQARDGYSDSSS